MCIDKQKSLQSKIFHSLPAPLQKNNGPSLRQNFFSNSGQACLSYYHFFALRIYYGHFAQGMELSSWRQSPYWREGEGVGDWVEL